MNRSIGWAVAVAAIALSCGVLGFYQATDAAPRAENQPFANSVEQRIEMVDELKAIHDLLKEQNALLKEQNDLLRDGKIKVVVTQPDKP